MQGSIFSVPHRLVPSHVPGFEWLSRHDTDVLEFYLIRDAVRVTFRVSIGTGIYEIIEELYLYALCLEFDG